MDVLVSSSRPSRNLCEHCWSSLEGSAWFVISSVRRRWCLFPEDSCYLAPRETRISDVPSKIGHSLDAARRRLSTFLCTRRTFSAWYSTRSRRTSTTNIVQRETSPIVFTVLRNDQHVQSIDRNLRWIGVDALPWDGQGQLFCLDERETRWVSDPSRRVTEKTSGDSHWKAQVGLDR